MLLKRNFVGEMLENSAKIYWKLICKEVYCRWVSYFQPFQMNEQLLLRFSSNQTPIHSSDKASLQFAFISILKTSDQLLRSKLAFKKSLTDADCPFSYCDVLQIIFGGNSAYFYNQLMKKKQLILKRLQKEGVSHAKILSKIDQTFPLLGIEEIAAHFINKKDHDEELQNIDRELLEIIFKKLMETPQSSSKVEQEKQKIDVLTIGYGELLPLCFRKGLINVHQYCQTIKNKAYKNHSYYGYLLVATFPDQFEIGPRCTHYHCKTTAHKIEMQYGIHNKNEDDKEKDDNEEHQSDEDFIKNSDSQSEESVIAVKRKPKKGKPMKEKRQESPVKEVKKKRKNMILQESDEEEQKVVSGRKYAKGKMNLEQDNQKKKEDDLILKALEQLKLITIIEILDYQAIFEYLSENHIERLRPLMDPISEMVLLNKKQSKREESDKKNKKSHKKRLARMKINLKELTLEDLVTQCFKKNIISQQEYEEWQLRYEQNDHPRLAYDLLQAQPEEYIIQGTFNPYPQEELNQTLQKAYQEYQNKEVDGDEEQQDQEEQEQSQFLEENDEENGSDYSIDPDEEDLGII